MRALLACAAVLVASTGALPAHAEEGQQDGNYQARQKPRVQVYRPIAHSVSRPLRDIKPRLTTSRSVEKRPRIGPNRPRRLRHDPVLQPPSAAPSPAAPGTSRNFDGVGRSTGYLVNGIPPDTNGAVGDTQYVQWVNTAFAVFDKSTGKRVAGPTNGNTLWTGFGGLCESQNDGDPVAQYDKAHQRWVMTQFAVPNGGPYLQCVAVSTSSDATGSWNRYAYSLPNFNDYGKLGVWPDGYYMSFNMFNGNTFLGGNACAMDSTTMVAGGAAPLMQCFQQNSSVGGQLPSDVDGTIQPTPGEPNFFVNFDTNALDLWKFHVNWVTPGLSTFTGFTPVTGVAAFDPACSGGGTCIVQRGTSQQLDSLGDRLMYRLAYRRFADGHEALVVSHSVTATGPPTNLTGARWYEIWDPNGTPNIHQQGTYAPADGNSRWMPSIAMDQSGDIAMGYSVSGPSTFPGIRYVGRTSGDPLGMMTTAEATIKAGAGSQTAFGRWGDYSSMSVDPVDDCTFWYTNEYLPGNGNFNWNTRIGSFRFPRCGQWASVVPAVGSPTAGDWLFGSSCSNSGAALPPATPQRCFAVGYRPIIGAAIGDIFRSASGGAAVGTGWTLNTSTTAGNNGLTAISCSPKARNPIPASPGSATCYAVGGKGLVLKTTNNGDTWTAGGPPTALALYGIDCQDDIDCWAAGDQGSLWQTRDGTTWNNFSLTVPSTTDAFFGVSCISAATCEAVGSNGLAVHITSADAVAPTIVREVRPVTTSLNNVSCPGGATTDCIAASDGPSDAFKHAAVLWAPTTAQPAAVTLLGAGCQTFPGADASSVGCSVSGPGGRIFTTSDGGTTWTADITGTTNELDALDCSLSVTFCLAVGQNGTILRR